MMRILPTLRGGKEADLWEIIAYEHTMMASVFKNFKILIFVLKMKILCWTYKIPMFLIFPKFFKKLKFYIILQMY